MIRNTAAAIAAASVCSVASAGIVGGTTVTVNEDLGLISGTVNLVGDTANGQDAIGFYDGLSDASNNLLNEFVYSFTVSQLTRLDTVLNAQGGDIDTYLLDGPGLGFDPGSGKSFATNAVAESLFDFETVGTLGLLLPGVTYFYSVDTFSSEAAGVPGATPTSSYDITLNLVTDGGGAPAPPSFTDLGVVADAFVPFSIDTFDTEFDTELALWTASGLLAQTNDDGGPSVQSLIELGQGLPAGDYFLALGSFDTEFADGFGFTAGDEGGAFRLTVNGNTTTGTQAVGETGLFRFTVVPAPSTAALALLAGGVAIRRRRA